MPKNLFQRMIFALLTVMITVPAFVFFSLYVVEGGALLAQNPGATGVLDAIRQMGGVYMLGHFMPIWSVILIELAFAYTLACGWASSCAFKIACNMFNPRETHHVIFGTTIICATVMLMCPSMSLIAAFLYYPYYDGFNILTLLANWFKLVCYNFPFAFFSQLFFIQPLVRAVFRFIFRKDIATRQNTK